MRLLKQESGYKLLHRLLAAAGAAEMTLRKLEERMLLK